ncbi:MAG: helical backbone metal receptor [Chloroflexota bacterium]
MGGFSTPNIEEIVARNPDLILATSRHEDKVIPQLEDKGLTVLALDPRTVDEVLEAIELVGKVTGETENADTLTAGMRERIKAVTDKTAGLTPEQRVKTFYILWHDPLMTVGSGTLQNELINKAGGVNLAADIKDYADISLETVVAGNPGVIIAAVGHGSGAEGPFVYARDEDRLRDTDARLNDRVYFIDGNLTSRPGPRIVDGLEQLARIIHPEIFGEPEPMQE